MDALLKTLNGEIVSPVFTTQDPENHTLFSGTYPTEPNKGVLHWASVTFNASLSAIQH